MVEWNFTFTHFVVFRWISFQKLWFVDHAKTFVVWLFDSLVSTNDTNVVDEPRASFLNPELRHLDWPCGEIQSQILVSAMFFTQSSKRRAGKTASLRNRSFYFYWTFCIIFWSNFLFFQLLAWFSHIQLY